MFVLQGPRVKNEIFVSANVKDSDWGLLHVELRVFKLVILLHL